MESEAGLLLGSRAPLVFGVGEAQRGQQHQCEAHMKHMGLSIVDGGFEGSQPERNLKANTPT